LKRRLRQSPIIGSAYRSAASNWHRTRIRVHEQIRGRYHDAGHFDRLFAHSDDPWRYQGDVVSESRRELLLRMLPEQRCQRMLEIGCATGWITEHLAQRAETLLAVDISNAAIARAKERCEGLIHVDFECVDLLHGSLHGQFETIVCAGVLVYLPWNAQRRLRDHIASVLAPHGHLLLEHLREAGPGECAGDQIHALYTEHPRLQRLATRAQDGYEIALFRAAS
jgi:2-polyprenyl-3-methyl-5-hydroxy-6-metoxy-1,4-benzoquinol methylase